MPEEPPLPKRGELADARYKYIDSILKAATVVVALVVALVGFSTYRETSRNNAASQLQEFKTFQETVRQNDEQRAKDLRDFLEAQSKETREARRDIERQAREHRFQLTSELREERRAQEKELRAERFQRSKESREDGRVREKEHRDELNQRDKEFRDQRVALNREFRQNEQMRDFEYRKPLYQQQMTLYMDAAKAAAALATSYDPEERNKSYRRFWQLYYGELPVIEEAEVNNAMVDFAKLLLDAQQKNWNKVDTPALANTRVPDFRPEQRVQLQQASLRLSKAFASEFIQFWRGDTSKPAPKKQLTTTKREPVNPDEIRPK